MIGAQRLTGDHMGRFKRVTVLAMGCAVVACSSDPVGPDDALGDWGGEGASVTVSAVATDFEFDCATGQVEGLLTLDSQGDFTADGVYFRGGGPLPIGGRVPIPARYEGTVDGNRMTLFVLLEGSDPIGPRSLRRGEEPFLRRCL